MTTLADMPFETLQAGMKFKHPERGEQIILDLGHGPLGPAIQFHNSEMYSGQMPKMIVDPRQGGDEEEGDIFEAMARSTYPYGAENWEYGGSVSPEEIAAHGWQWFQVACPHCGFARRLLAAQALSGKRRCRACGMVFDRPTQPAM
jgi:predicted RNA-binding Zn-ribbon protein involved in translation (DUF1610 family)